MICRINSLVNVLCYVEYIAYPQLDTKDVGIGFWDYAFDLGAYLERRGRHAYYIGQSLSFSAWHGG